MFITLGFFRRFQGYKPLFLFFLLIGFAAPQQSDAQPQESFEAFVETIGREARGRGVSRATFENAFARISPDPEIIALTQKQSEFTKPIWNYVDASVAHAKLERGNVIAKQYQALLAAVEKRYGVDRRVILGIWGMETNFGANTGKKDIIRSLATLAYMRYRDDFFKDELLIVLEMLEKNLVERSQLRGSWAGAMGHPQFMPSSFMKYAVDGDGDGVRDIWESVSDTLASIAHYMQQSGWERGVLWGVEVKIPPTYRLGLGREYEAFSAWSTRGFVRVDNKPLPKNGQARLFLPAGFAGPAFLITPNYAVIKKYNASDAYALGVSHLGDRLLGGGAIKGRWPREAKLLNVEELKELQNYLSSYGLVNGKIDGKIGEQSREAIKKAQTSLGMVPDGFPYPALLMRLRQQHGR